MKKVFAFISILAVSCAAMFAEVTAKKLADGKVEATFFYGNPRATEVLLAGSFTDWQNGALPMEKGDKGFTLTKVFDAGTTVKYKFISDGNWTTDLKAPDFIDDGFGGKNSCADLDELAGGADAGAAPKSGLKFQTWSNVGLQSSFDIVEKDGAEYKNDFEPLAVDFGAKSYWKVGGSVVPHVPVYIEIALAEYEPDNMNGNLYKRNSLDLGDGMENFLTDLFFDPIYMLDSGIAPKADQKEKTYLGHFRTGVETGWVDWTMGYKYAKLPAHKNVNWDTVDQDWEAGYNAVGGYSQFSTGMNFKEWLKEKTDGNVDLELVFAPNRSADRAGSQYGVYSYADATLFKNHYVDVQYNGAYGSTYGSVLENIYENDIILGYKGTFGPLTLKANYLVNLYGSTDNGNGTKTLYTPGSSDVGIVNDDPDEAIDNMAMNVNVTFSNDVITAMAGARFRGDQANLMYVEQNADDHDHIQDNLGKKNTIRYFADISAKPMDALTIGFVPYLETTLLTDTDDYGLRDFSYNNTDTYKFVGRLKAGYQINDKMSVDGYGEVSYVTEEEDEFVRGSETESFIFNEAGLKFSTELDGAVSKVEVIYGYNGNESAYALHSLLASADVPNGITVSAGVGVRTQFKDVDDFDETGVLPAGFALGASKEICKKYSTTLVAQFLYGFNPYNDFGDKWANFKLDDYIVDRDITAAKSMYNKAALRVGLTFDF